MRIAIKDALQRRGIITEKQRLKISDQYPLTPNRILYRNKSCMNDRMREFYDAQSCHKASSFSYFNSSEADNNFNYEKRSVIPLLNASSLENIEHKNANISSAKVFVEDETLSENSTCNISKSSINSTQSIDEDTLINIPTSTKDMELIKPTAIINGNDTTVHNTASHKRGKLDRSSSNRIHNHSRLSFRQRLNKYIEMSHDILSTGENLLTEAGSVVSANNDNTSSKTKDSSNKQPITRCRTTKTLPTPSTRALSAVRTNGECTAAWGHPGIICCPLLEIYGTSPSISTRREEDINLSPFKLWRFKPFLQPRQDAFYKTKYTLVLDLDETLVSTSVEYIIDADAVLTVQMSPTTSEAQYLRDVSCKKVLVGAKTANTVNEPKSDSYTLYIKYRPHLKDFLDFCLEHFEVVIFTASKKNYATAVLGQIQEDFGIQVILPEDPLPSSHAQIRRTITLLHRDHCTPTNAGFVKDLFMLGRNLRTTVMVDNVAMCGFFQPFNLIRVKDFVWHHPTHSKTKIADRIGDPDSCSPAFVGAEICKPRLSSNPSATSDGLVFDDDSYGLEFNCSTAIWDHFEDNVLRDLTGPRGVLRRMVHRSDVPRFLFQAMLSSMNAASNVEENDIN